MTMTADALLHEISAIKDYLNAVRSILASGHMPEMIGLEQRVGKLCVQLQDAEEDVQKKCVGNFKNLLEDLNACENDMRAFHTAHLAGGKASS